MKRRIFMKKILLFAIFFSLHTNAAQGAQVGATLKFYVEPVYDLSGREELTAILIKTAPKIYFYADQNWWDLNSYSRQNEILSSLDSLGKEFNEKIYPTLTSVFGSEWNPGIDGEERISVLLQPMKEGVGGYVRTADEYLKIQIPESNEKELIYFAISQIGSPL